MKNTKGLGSVALLAMLILAIISIVLGVKYLNLSDDYDLLATEYQNLQNENEILGTALSNATKDYEILKLEFEEYKATHSIQGIVEGIINPDDKKDDEVNTVPDDTITHISFEDIENYVNRNISITGVIHKNPDDKEGVYELILPDFEYKTIKILETDIPGILPDKLVELNSYELLGSGKGNGFICTVNGKLVQKKAEDSWLTPKYYYLEGAKFDFENIILDDEVTAEALLSSYEYSGSVTEDLYNGAVIKITGTVSKIVGDKVYLDCGDIDTYTVYIHGGEYKAGDKVDTIGISYVYNYTTKILTGEIELDYK